jgi:hypothetical protein
MGDTDPVKDKTVTSYPTLYNHSIEYSVPLLVEKAVKLAGNLETALSNVEKVNTWVDEQIKGRNGKD